jgi:peptidoglycan hydrolase-like protein with peptidoglycan-binding domain
MLRRLQGTAGNFAAQRLARSLPLSTSADPEAQASLLGGSVAPRMPRQPVTSTGRLTPEAEVAAEPVTGPDADVRVSTDGDEIANQDGPAGADAMTLHGQIFVDPAIDLATPYGSRVLGHELVHVGQQRHGGGRGPQFHNGEHPLLSPDLLDDPGMVKAFKNNPAIRKDRKGDTVKLLQTRLLKFGYQLPKSIKQDGELDGDFGDETFDAVKMFQRDHGLVDDGVVGHQTVTVLDELGPAPSPSTDPIADALAEGEETKKWTVEEFIVAWEKKEGRKMTEQERESLALGCIGITVLNLQQGNVAPPLNLSFDTFAQAKAVAAALDAILAAQPALDQLPDAIAANPTLAALKNVQQTFPVTPDPYEYKAIVFSKRFWSNQSTDAAERENPDDEAFQPDPVTGQVEMKDYRYAARPGQVNFDYGWYDEETDSWWHANHADPGMEVYQSTLEHYSRPLKDFDRQVFSVAFARKPK